jgi:hypothetical protein
MEQYNTIAIASQHYFIASRKILANQGDTAGGMSKSPIEWSN